MKYFFTKTAQQSLELLDVNLQKRIISKIHFFCNSTNPLIYAKNLTNLYAKFRFRIGDYRVFFDI